MRTLVTSASRKIPLLRAIASDLALVDESSPDAVIAGDSDSACLASYAWQRFWAMPGLDDQPAQTLAATIASHGIEFIIPTRDDDVLFYAQNREEFVRHGIAVMAPDARAVALCTDKLAFAEHLVRHGIPAIATATTLSDVESMADRYVAKERFGAGSRNAVAGVSAERAAQQGAELASAIYQPFVTGQELSIDAFRSREGVVLALVARTRDLVIGGESQVTTTVDPGPYVELVTQTLDALDYHGHALIQVIESTDGPGVVECNPRLGGASTLALACGLHSVAWSLLEARGLSPSLVEPVPPAFPVRLIRTPQDEIDDARLRS